MLYAAIVGDYAPSYQRDIYAVISRFCATVSVAEYGITANSDSPQIILSSFTGDCVLDCEKTIVIFSGKSHCHVQVNKNAVVISEFDNTAAAAFAQGKDLFLLDCGLSGKASVTFSSMKEEDAVVSLQRSIKDMQGNACEPMEISLDISSLSPKSVLMAISILIVAGMLPQQ